MARRVATDPIPDEAFDLAHRIVGLFVTGTRAQYRALTADTTLDDDPALRADLVQLAHAQSVLALSGRRVTRRLPDRGRQAELVAEICAARQFGELLDPFVASSADRAACHRYARYRSKQFDGSRPDMATAPSR